MRKLIRNKNIKFEGSILIQWLKKFLKKVLSKQIIEWLNARRENSRYRSWRIRWAIREKISSPQNVYDLYETTKFYWINPQKIRYRTLNEFHYFRDHNRVVGGDWDIFLSPIEENYFFQAFSKIINEGKEWSDTEYYKRNLAQILEGKVKWGCKSKEEWDQRCAMLEAVYNDIKNNGYHPQRIEDYISVNIGRDGQILFNNGRHRLTFCKLLEVSEIPIRITVRHAKWVMFKNQIFEYAQKSKTGKIYAPLTHIDLQSIPSCYGHKRFELIQKNITAPYKGTVLDIGSNWGYFCHKLEDLSFDCIAVENNPKNLYFLEKLKKAEERNFSIFNKSIFFLDITKKKYDIVLALAIFHHFIKEEETYHQLIHFLKNIHVGEMYFEPHEPNEPQMQNAFRNFNGLEFIEFIIKNSCLQYYKQIGLSEDGRKLYKIW